MNWDDGCKYDGDWKDDVRHGKGTFEYTNGDKYEGDWADDIQHGKGTYFSIQETVMRVLISQVSVPVQGFIIMLMVINMQETLKMVCRTEEALLPGQTVLCMKVSGK